MTTTEETPKDKSTEREEFLKYGFEKGKNSFAAEGRKDVEVFKKKLNLKKDSNLNQLLETFGQVNLRNIHFYEKKIQDEQKQVRKFSILTLSIVAGLPIFIFIYTNYSETIFHTDIDDLSATGTVLSALLTSLLGVHQLLSNWTEKKRFRSNFFSAKTALMDILFELEEKYKSFDGEPPSDLAMVELQEDLTEAIKKSRIIVNDETKAFMELSSTPAVNLKEIFETSSAITQSLIGSFTSKKYSKRVEELEKEEKETKEKIGNAKNSLEQKTIALKSAYRNLASLEKRTQIVDERMDVLEDKGLDQLTDNEQDEYEKLKVKFDSFDDERDKLLDTIESLQSEVDSLEIALREYQK